MPLRPRRALLAVYDKRGLADFAAGLSAQGVQLIATGGTERALRQEGLPVTPVSELTGAEELLDGRVKTLHPVIHAGLLARRQRQGDMATLERLGIPPIDLVAVNLYPFAEVLARSPQEEELVEAIDIGGPTLLRAAAKNHSHVAAISSPDQYVEVLNRLGGAGLEDDLLRRLAAEAFLAVSTYDALIGAHLRGTAAISADGWPRRLGWAGELAAPLRYGENPHQPGALYRSPGEAGGLAQARLLSGPPLSYTNWLDADAGWGLARRLSEPAVVIVKHSNPCGVAQGRDLSTAFQLAYDCDPRSAYGGVVAVNRELDLATAELLAHHFLELVLAPGLTEEAKERLAQRERLRVLELDGAGPGTGVQLRSIDGGVLAQLPDTEPDPTSGFQVVSARPPTPGEWSQLHLAWAVVRAVKSNAIVLCREGMAVGIGAGQMSRVEAVELAVSRAGGRAEGSVLASDAFFPMADGLEVAAVARVTAAIHPGGSVRDQEVLAAADRAGMALVATGRRHFRH